jgi:hypothetical protein
MSSSDALAAPATKAAAVAAAVTATFLLRERIFHALEKAVAWAQVRGC